MDPVPLSVAVLGSEVVVHLLRLDVVIAHEVGVHVEHLPARRSARPGAHDDLLDVSEGARSEHAALVTVLKPSATSCVGCAVGRSDAA